MSKTAEETLKDTLTRGQMEIIDVIQTNIEQAMQTYAQVVLQWVSENCTYNSELMMWGYKDDLYNYEQLIELFTQQKEK